jgi:alkaline phosphatase
MLWGPQADKVPFQPLVDRGPGKLPGLRFLSNNHTNSLTPLHARGAGSGRFRDLIRGIDPTAAKVWGGSGQFIDNTDIFTAMRDAALETADSAVSP